MGKLFQLCVYEPCDYFELLPVVHVRPVFDLTLGVKTLLDRICSYYPEVPVSLFCRDSLQSLMSEVHPHKRINQLDRFLPTVFLAGGLVLDISIFTQLGVDHLETDTIFSLNGQIVGAYLCSSVSKLEFEALLRTGFQGLPVVTLTQGLYVSKLWDLVALNLRVLNSDLDGSGVYREANVKVEEFVFFNTEKGPIYLSEGVFVEAGSRLEGPLFVGPYTQILGGKIKTSTIGAYCKVSGEVSESVISSYSNKAHAGFLGNSYIGEWVNLGAGTTTSNLKNTYGEISLIIRGESVKTGLQFLGSIFADYVKTGIGTLLNAGTVIGLGSSIWGSVLHDKDIPDFSWGESGVYGEIRGEKMLEIAQKMMARRNQILSPAKQLVIENLYVKKDESHG